MNREVSVSPIVATSFVAALALAALAVRTGFVGDDALRLWAGASTAADGDVPFGRIIAAYPTLPFLTTTLVACLTPEGTPAPALVAAGLFALVTGCCFLTFRRLGFTAVVAGVATILIAFHPALLRAAIEGPADMFLAVFLLTFCLALYDLRARVGASEVMALGLSLLALAFSHPIGAAVAFAVVPFLLFAVPPTLVAGPAWNVVLALIFPTVFSVGVFAYVSWIFPGDGWSFMASPAQSLSIWTADFARTFGGWPSGLLAVAASLAVGIALVAGAPVAVVALVTVRRRRPLVVPALVFAATIIAATAISVADGLFGDPTAIAVAAPVLAAVTIMRVPDVRRWGAAFVIALLVLGWIGGLSSLTLTDPAAAAHLTALLDGGAGEHERLDALGAGGAAAGREGILADTDNAPIFVLGRGRSHGILGSSSEPFALAMLFSRIDAPFVAVPDPESSVGMRDRLNKAFPSLFRLGPPGYRVVYQNNTWRIFERMDDNQNYEG